MTADALCRAPLMPADQHDKHFEEDIQTYMDASDEVFQQPNGDLKRFDFRKRMTHCVKNWPNNRMET